MTATARSNPTIARQVRDVMDRSVHHARLGDSISQVARYMSELRAAWIVVVDARNRVVGLVSDRKVLQFYLSYIDTNEFEVSSAAMAANHTVIDTLLTSEKLHKIRYEASLEQAAETFRTSGVEFLPVVDRYEELKGLLSISDLLQEFTINETAGLETGFEFFEPLAGQARQRPAFVRRANKELVIPLDRVAAEHEFTEKVILGFDETSGRVLIKFIPAGMKSAGATEVRRQGENLVIAAEAFVRHYRLLDRSTTFDTETPDDTRYLVLVPR